MRTRILLLILALVGSVLAACATRPAAQPKVLDTRQVTIRGAVRWVDKGGGVPKSGSFNLFLDSDPGTEPRAIDVNDGEWSIQLHVNFHHDIRVGRMTLDGHEAHCETVFDESAAKGGLVLEARATKKNLLRVFSKSTGREADSGLELVANDDSIYPDTNRGLHLTGLGSPIELPEFDTNGWEPEHWQAQRTWWLRGPRLAWTRLNVDHTQGGERRIELEAAGVLVVTLTSSERLDELYLRLEQGLVRSESRAVRVGPDPIEFEGLAAGDYRLVVDRGDLGNSVQLATRDVRIAAQDATELTIDLSPRAPAAGEMPLYGSIRIPAEWGSIPFSIELSRLASAYQSIGEPMMGVLESNFWRWDAGMRQAGRYMAFVKPFQWSFVFDYEPKTAYNFELVIPPPADVCVKLIDKLTGQPIRDEQLGWYGMPPREPSGIMGVNVPFKKDRDGFCFKSPVGDIVLTLADAEQSIRFEPVHIAPGSNTVELKCAPYVRVRVFPVENGVRVEWPESVFVRGIDNGSSGHYRRNSYDEAGMQVLFDAPGNFEIQLGELTLDGEKQFESTSVRVEAVRERIVEVELPLKRRP